MAKIIKEDYIKNIIEESLKELVIRKQVENIVSESLQEVIKTKLNEASNSNMRKTKSDKNTNKSGATKSKYKAVMSALSDDSLNHAQLMRDLWHPSDKKKEDELRSLFSKMATGKPDADGAVRQFSPDEINKLYELIRGVGK